MFLRVILMYYINRTINHWNQKTNLKCRNKILPHQWSQPLHLGKQTYTTTESDRETNIFEWSQQGISFTCSSIKCSRPTGSDPKLLDAFDGCFFDYFVARETKVIMTCKIKALFTVQNKVFSGLQWKKQIGF